MLPIARLVAPPALHAGDSLPLQVTVRSTVAGSAVLSLRRDGPQSAAPAGHARPGRQPAPADPARAGRGLSFLRNPRPARRRRGTRERRPRCRHARRAAAPDRRSQAPEDLRWPPSCRPTGCGSGTHPRRAADDVARLSRGRRGDPRRRFPAPAIGDTRSVALTEAVRTDGLGLLAFGGEQSFSLGRYAGSPLAGGAAGCQPGGRASASGETWRSRSSSTVPTACRRSAGGVPRIRPGAGGGEGRELHSRPSIATSSGSSPSTSATRTLVPRATVTPGARARASERAHRRSRPPTAARTSTSPCGPGCGRSRAAGCATGT